MAKSIDYNKTEVLNTSGEVENDQINTKYPFHPRKRPKIANVAAINDFRFFEGNLQFNVTENFNNWRWLNSTDFYAPEKVNAFWKQLASQDSQTLKPKPYAEYAKEANIDPQMNIPKNIVAQLSHKQEKKPSYLVENELGQQSVMSKEEMHDKYPNLVKEFFNRWVPIGAYDSASAKKTLSETVQEVLTRANLK